MPRICAGASVGAGDGAPAVAGALLTDVATFGVGAELSVSELVALAGDAGAGVGVLSLQPTLQSRASVAIHRVVFMIAA